MTRRWFYPVAVMAFCLVPNHSDASMNDHYAADSYGVIRDTQIDALATTLVGRPYTIDCTPDPGDGSIGRTVFYGESNDDGTVTYDVPLVSELNGDQCGAIDKLINYTPGYFHQHEVAVVSIKPLKKKRKLQSLVIYTDDRTWFAANALLTLEHEAMHARLASSPFTDDGSDTAPPLDEARVECLAISNIWPLIASLPIPAWLKTNMLYAAKDSHAGAPVEYLEVC